MQVSRAAPRSRPTRPRAASKEVRSTEYGSAEGGPRSALPHFRSSAFLRVDRLQCAPGRDVVARYDERVGCLLDVDLELAERAPEEVLVDDAVGQDALAQGAHRVDGIARHERVAVREP